ncbi:MAG: PEGA domain-containing protein [Myxococcales bacterium]|nr:PEGA domain-containing protein [Myxococcales bacterium]
MKFNTLRWMRGMTVAAVALVALCFASSASAQSHPALSGGKYPVKIESAPPGATVYIDRKELGAVGVTPWQGKMKNGDFLVIVELDGYQLAQKNLKVARTRKVQSAFIPLIKKVDPPRIDIRADADQNVFGATVYLDGQSQGAAPVLLTTTSGRHLVELKREGFDNFQTWVEVKDNEKASLTPVMKAVAKPKLGTVVVEADVPDADVYLDGNKQNGTTPMVLTDVVEGLHVVEVRKDPGVPWKQTIQVLAGQQAKIRGELKATLGGQGGTVRVLSNVTGAEVFLDGTNMGKVPIDIKQVKGGEHVLEVKAPGYQPHEERITINDGQSTVLKLDLNAEAGAGGKGTLKVVSAVPDADVYIDGAGIGKVPQEKAVGRGDHFVMVKLAGFKTFEQKVRIEEGQTLTVSAELKAVARIRVLSDPVGGEVLVNGLPQGVTPLELNDVEVGTTIVRVQKAGYQPWEQTLNLEGGKNEILSATLKVEGLSDDALKAQQRGLSSWGARTMPRGRSTVDLSIGYPYFVDVRVAVGAGKMSGLGFDANVGVRSMGSRSEIGLGARLMLVDNDPFSAGVFGNLWWGSKLLDDSKRNGGTFAAGGIASLTAFTHVTITARGYLEFWSDRHCPELTTDPMGAAKLDGDAIDTCTKYLNRVGGPGDGTGFSAEQAKRVEDLTGQSGSDFFTRENGVRFMTSVVAEISLRQRWNGWVLLEFAPFQSERALFVDDFTQPMLTTDYNTYARAGVTYKF